MIYTVLNPKIIPRPQAVTRNFKYS